MFACGPALLTPANVRNYLLDSYTANAWSICSLRKRITAYAGSSVRVRRSNDNLEADIGFNADGMLNTTALATHVGSNSGYVVKFYDQSGGLRDFSHATAANQPRIVNAGTYDGKLVFDGTANGLATASSSGTPSAFTALLNAKLRSSASVCVILEQSSNYNSNDAAVMFADPSTGANVNVHGGSPTPSYYAVSTFTGAYPNNNVQCYRVDRAQSSGANQAVFFIDGVKQTRTGSAGETSPLPSGNYTANPWYLGARATSSLFSPIDVFDLVIYEAAKSDADVAAISAVLAP